MALPGDHFVVEMARAATKSELDAVRSSTHVSNGELYEVHLRQNGADAWLLLWGSFDTLESARAARNSVSASATPGWPRRIAPLQAEARRVSP
jgi:septal ring-binding cell division protein DamX